MEEYIIACNSYVETSKDLVEVLCNRIYELTEENEKLKEIKE